jgi:Fe-S-cluster-containing hydrogenase component 2
MSEMNESIRNGPQSKMEKTLLEQYLKTRGYTFKDLCDLPEEEAKSLMIEACKYASLKLAQVESAARFRETIREPS